MGDDARDELAGNRAEAVGSAGIVGDGTAGLVPQAEMDMHTAADAAGADHRREGRLMSQAVRGGAGDLADNKRAVGGTHRVARAVGHFILLNAKFRHV